MSLFADDSFLLFKVIAAEAHSVKGILNSYETLSGQALNYQKFTVSFKDKQIELIHVMGVCKDIGDS